MLQNAYLLAKISADTAENEQHFAENFKFYQNFAVSVGGCDPVIAVTIARGETPPTPT